MNYRIDTEKKTAAYLQLYTDIRDDIISGVYKYGEKLPSKRMLAEETGVSVITTGHALEILCEEGYAEARPRSGCYVIYRSTDFQGNPAAASSEIFSQDKKIEGTELFPFSQLAKTMRKVLLDYGEQVLIKGPNHGNQELCIELKDYLARSRGIKVDPEQIIVGSGAEYLYGLAAQLLKEEGTFALEDPSYDKIRKVYEAMGIHCEFLKLKSDGIDSQALKDTTACVLHVTPFHSFPSGITADASKKYEYLRWAQERQGYIIEDNYDSELTVSQKAEESLFSMSKKENVIYINTFSKTIAPSMRMGYMILPEGLLKKFEEKLGFYSCTVPGFEQFVLARLLKNGSYERHVNTVRRQRRNKSKMQE